MRQQSKENSRIQRALDKRKKYLVLNEPICIFCLHLVTRREIAHGEADLCHKIRRSEKSDVHDNFTLQTMDLNNGLGHRDCHHVFDNVPEEAVRLPGFESVMIDVYKIDKKLFCKIVSNIYFLYLAADSILWNYYNR